jgi:transcription antitermination factor NusB
MGLRRRARELAIQVLFHLEFTPGDPNRAFELICESFPVRESLKDFALVLILGVCEQKGILDRVIRKASRNWRVERMSKLDISILRVAAYEIIFREDIPPKVSINEAVELAKRYGSEESGSFINGVLDHIYSDTYGADRCDAEHTDEKPGFPLEGSLPSDGPEPEKGTSI